MNLKIGIEIDVSKNYGIDPAQLPFSILNKFDYILFEYVNTENEYWGQVGSRDISDIIKVRKRFTIPIGIAHNDLQGNYEGKEKEIADILAKNDIFVELNQSEFHLNREVGRNTRNGSDYYQHFSQELLKHMAKKFLRYLFIKNTKVVVGTDSHTGESLVNFSDVYQFIKKNHLSYHKIVS